jgi:O-antigen ligase
MVSGQAAHSSYFGIYFSYGIFAAVFWLIMCIMGVWASTKMLLLYKRSGQYPLAPFCVFYYLILGLAETYFDVIISGFGALFYISCGLCMLKLRRHKNEAIYGYLTEMDYIYDSDFAAQD